MGGGFCRSSHANGFALKADWTGQILDQVSDISKEFSF